MTWGMMGAGAVTLVLVTANAFTTRRLWSSAMFERPQKIAQTILLWLIPGTCFVVRHFLTEPAREPIRDPTIGEGAFDATEYLSHHHGGGGGGGGSDHH